MLEGTIIQARTIAVTGARLVLSQQYAVDRKEPWPHTDPDFRRRLRARGRQLGDVRDPRDGTQNIEHLAQACAYEHWNRMLFARFLAENDLLLDPKHGVPMTLADVKELAGESGADWLAIASDYALKMLLAVFRLDDPVLQVVLPPEARQQLEEKLEALPAEVFLADDSLGWVYQFWQSNEKDRVNKSEVKIGADELPAVTQLFTEDYMVLFLLENTLGAWWTAKRRAEGKDPALPGYTWTYLRLNDDGSPVAGSFDGWPRAARDLRVLDPCMGSGHFLVIALPILARMRMEEEDLSLQNALAAVLRDNLFGLEIDARCAEIAAFNLALTAWRLAGEHFQLPKLNLACSGLGINATESQWMAVTRNHGPSRDWMQKLYALFRQAPILGSLIDPRGAAGELFEKGFEAIKPVLEEALGKEQVDEESEELAIAASGLLAAAQILVRRYNLVATNVPFKDSKQLTPALQEHLYRFLSAGGMNLATAFLLRIVGFLQPDGTAAVVSPQEWLFLKTYEPIRRRLLGQGVWHFLADLGEHAFESPQAAGAFPALVGFSRGIAPADQRYLGLDVTGRKRATDKSAGLRMDPLRYYLQADQIRNPEARIGFLAASKLPPLSNYAGSYVGLQNGDSPRFVLNFWELPVVTDEWSPFQMPCNTATEYGGRSGLLHWEGGHGSLAHSEGLYIKGKEAWGKQGVAIRQTRRLPATRYTGDLYDQSSAAIVPFNQSHLPAIWAYCSSPQFHDDVRKIDKKKNVTNATLVKVPFDLAYWQKVAAEKYPTGLPDPYSDEPTQWLFNGHPRGSTNPLQVAVARLVGYRWPRQTRFAAWSFSELQIDGLEHHADPAGIVCLNPAAGAASGADRLRGLLAEAYGVSWSATTLKRVLAGSDSVESWLRDHFFEEHCEIFDQRPFVWHIWDGRKDGFHAFVNYHRLAVPNGEGRQTLERLIYTLLGDWIARQKAEVASAVEGADARLSAAFLLKAELEKILAGEDPHDIFVRWKPIQEQPIGWEPDINDGVRLNIRPWLAAGILRVKPRIPYGKDRGKEPARDKDDFPWFAKSNDRDNDIHLNLATKRSARERKRAAVAK
jgi:hypothetical protein